MSKALIFQDNNKVIKKVGARKNSTKNVCPGELCDGIRRGPKFFRESEQITEINMHSYTACEEELWKLEKHQQRSLATIPTENTQRQISHSFTISPAYAILIKELKVLMCHPQEDAAIDIFLTTAKLNVA